MKSKNVFLLIALMLVTSIFCSSCIIVHDWDDEYVYTAVSSKSNFQREYGPFSDTGVMIESTSYKYKFNDKNFYFQKDYQYMSRTDIRNYFRNHYNSKYTKLSLNDFEILADKFYNSKHMVVDILDGETVYSISK